MRCMRPLPVAILLVTWLGAFACSTAHGQETSARIHLLVVADTNDPKIGESVKADLKAVPEVFRGNVPDWQLHVETISGLRVRPERIVATIQRMNIQPARDTIVFYYSGHGGYDQQAREHVLYPHRRPLAMRAIRAALEQTQPRLAVALTDTCSNFVSVAVAEAAIYPPPTRISAAFKSLFLDPTGFVFVSSTKPGQEAKGGLSGGFFTFTFLKFVHGHHDRTLSWSSVVANVNDAIETGLARVTRQTAYLAAAGSRGNVAGTVSSTPDNTAANTAPVAPSESPATPPAEPDSSPSPPGRLRFGIVADRTASSAGLNGVEVLRVEPNSPATSLRGRDGQQYRLVPGRDVITHVNGDPVTTNAEIVAAVARSPANMVVRVHDLQAGSAADYDVNLASANGPLPDAAPSVPGSVNPPNELQPQAHPVAPAGDRYAAIALSASTSRYGCAWGYSTQSEAEESAKSGCNSSDARIVIWSRNSYCALAFGPLRVAWGAAWAETAEGAAHKAIENCGQHTRLSPRVAVCVSASEGVVQKEAER